MNVKEKGARKKKEKRYDCIQTIHSQDYYCWSMC